MDKQDFEKLGVSELKVSWHTKLILKFWPKLYLRFMARKIGVDNPLFDKAHDVFSKVKRIDLFPSGGADGRGLTMILDCKTALFFYQDGDHFIYDGFEMGEYGRGEVTVFDTIKNPKSPYV